MAFSSYRPAFKTVKDAAGADLGQVRALNDSDMSLLWQKHEEAMETVFETVMSKGDAKNIDLGSAAMIAIRTAPDLVTDVICLASGEDDWAETFKWVSRMPIGIRVDIMKAIVDLTIYSEGGLEKLLGLLNLTRPQADL